MKIVTAKVLNHKGLDLLRDLESLKIIRLYMGRKDSKEVSANFIAKYKGSMNQTAID